MGHKMRIRFIRRWVLNFKLLSPNITSVSLLRKQIKSKDTY